MNKSSRIFQILILASFALSFLFPILAMAQANAGFVDKPIWFSNEPNTAGETVNISTLINNQDSKAIYGTVGFYNNDTLISKKNTTVNSGASSVVTISWKVTVGNHSIVAKFEDTKKVSATGDATEVTNQITSPYTFSVKAEVTTAPSKTESGSSTSTNSAGEVNGESSENNSTIANGVEEAKKAAENTFQFFDSFRAETALAFEKNVARAEAEVEAIKKAKEEAKEEGKVAGASTENIKVTGESKESFAKTPFAYLKLYFFKLANYIFAHKFLFYGLIVLLIILFVRYLIRAPR